MSDSPADALTSPRNERIKLVKRLVRDPAERRRHGACVVEGPRLAGEALAAGLRIRLVVASPAFLADAGSPLPQALRAAVAEAGGDWLTVADDVLAAASDVRTSQGVLAVVDRPDTSRLPDRPGPLVVAWEVGDPANVGAILRTCEASGCAAAIVARGPGGPAADPYSPRAVRAAAGSSFRLPVLEWTGGPGELPALLRARGLRVAPLLARGGSAPEEVDLSGDVALVAGSETRGLPEELVRDADVAVTIPVHGAESLNVAAAVAVAAFEAARQRRAAR